MSEDSGQDEPLDASPANRQWTVQWTAPDLDCELPPLGGKVLGVLTLAALFLLGLGIFPNFYRARAQGRLTSCKSNLKNIGTALEMYSTDWSGKYPSSTTVLTPNYLKTIPWCPIANKDTYRAQFGSSAAFNPDRYEEYYYVECFGENHTGTSVTGNFPAYNGIQGLIERAP